MRAMLVLYIAIILPAAILRGAQDVTPSGSVTGTITEAGTTAAIPNATILLRSQDGQPERTAKADLDGRFLIGEVLPGHYSVIVQRDGYYRPQRTGGWDTVTINAGQTLNIDAHLAPAGVISGRVLDENLDPLPGVHVEALLEVYRDGRRVLDTAGPAADTDDQGEYRLFWLTPGPYQVRATYTPRTPPNSTVNGGYTPMYFPGINSRDILPLTLLGGELSAIDFTMIPESSLRITGRIINNVTQDPGVAASEFFLIPRDPGNPRLGLSLPNLASPPGEFELRGVLPGAFTLYAMMSDDGVTYSGFSTVNVGDENVDGLQITIGTGQNIEGRIQYASSRSEENLAGVEVALRPANGMPAKLGPGPVRAGVDQNFKFEHVAPGSYLVTAAGLPPNAYVQSASLDGRDASVSPVTIGDESEGYLEVRIGDDAGHIQGFVIGSGGAFVPNARVVLAPADPALRGQISSYRVTTADQNGVFEFRNLVPADYKAFAWESVEEGAWFDPDFLAKVEDKGETFNIAPNGARTVRCIAIEPD